LKKILPRAKAFLRELLGKGPRSGEEMLRQAVAQAGYLLPKGTIP
jgi:hypothetical protein